MQAKRSGFTLTELIVCIFILAILMSLLLPAILKSKKIVLDLECKNNLRQIGLGCYSYLNTNSKFPNRQTERVDDQTGRNFYPFVELLPYIAEGQLKADMDPADDWYDINTRSLRVSEKNQINLNRGPKIYLCPSDPHAKPVNLSYRMNFQINQSPGNGNKSMPGSPTRVADGTSNTAFCSERVVSQAEIRSTAAMLVARRGHFGLDCVEGQLHPNEDNILDYYCGHTWMKNTNRHIAYTHYFPPNSSLLDCLFGSNSKGLLTARSGHNQGVNVLCFDGHVSFYSNSVDLQAWRSLGDPDDGR